MNTTLLIVISLVISYLIVYKIDPMTSASLQKDIQKTKKVEQNSKKAKEIAFIVCSAAIIFILSLLFD